jgi:hypothetical protein
MPRAPKKTPRNAAKNKVQASPGTAKGSKRPPRDLSEWIRLANLIRPGKQLPEFVSGQHSWPIVLEWIAQLEDPLRSELLAHSELREDDKDWQYFKDRPDMGRVLATYDHFVRIQIAATYVRLLARPEAEGTLDRLESFIVSLRYAELSYLRECEYCGDVFYASRKTQVGCKPAHGSAIRKKRKRDRDRADRKDPKVRAIRSKKKRTGLAPKR